jgi:ATP-dependent Lhr-like helicase
MDSTIDQRVMSAFFGRFTQLRDLQIAAIQAITSGRNVVLSAGTGSGKTEAVVAPMVSNFWRQAAGDDALFLLYISPTKALANDIEKRLQLPLSMLRLRVGIRHGDRDDLASANTPHILVTTPESLDVLLMRHEPKLASIRAVVIDEVHLLYNTQRGLQLSILLQRLKGLLAGPFQWAALSATIGDLGWVRDFLMGHDEDSEMLAFPASRPIDAQIRHIHSETEFLALIRRLLSGPPAKLLVFADSRQMCERLADVLRTDESLQDCVFCHYSSLAPAVRVETESKFAAAPTAVCLATSTLELGIDIGDISAIVLWGVPSGVDSFLQRIGRGNRRSNKSNVICLVPIDSKHAMIDALRFAALTGMATEGELPVRPPAELYGAVGQQFLSVIATAAGGYTRVTDLSALTQHRPYLTRKVAEDILAALAVNGYVQPHGFLNRYGSDEAIYRLIDLRLIYGNFPLSSQTVEVYFGAKHLGDVPLENLLRLRQGIAVRFAGAQWQVKELARDGIRLEPMRGATKPVDFCYSSPGPSADPSIINRVWRLIHQQEQDEHLFEHELAMQVDGFARQLRRVSAESDIPYIAGPDGFSYLTFAGSLVNRAVGLYTRDPDFEADDVSLLASAPIDWSSLPTDPERFEDVFDLMFDETGAQTIFQQQLPQSLQRREHLETWLKHPAIANALRRLSHARAVPLGFMPNL